MVGAARALRAADTMSCTYRGHGAVLAMGAPLDRTFGEILGKADGLCGGKGGSMHLTDMSVGAIGSFAVVGAHLPIGVGAAFAARYRATGAVSAVLLRRRRRRTSAPSTRRSTWRRSGRCRSSSSARTTSTASTRRSPGRRRSSASPTARPPTGCAPSGSTATTCARSTPPSPRRRRARAPARARRFIEALTYRQRGHSRSDPAAYRPEGELERWLERDPILLHESALAGAGVPRERLAADRATRPRGPSATRLERALAWPDPDPDVAVRARLRVTEATYQEAVNRAIADELEADDDVFLLGEDVGGRRRRVQDDRGPPGALRRASRARHADLRAGDRRDGDRRRGPGPAAAGRDHVRRLRGRLLRPDRQPAGQVPVHDGRAGAAAGDDPARQRRRRRLRRAALAAGRELVPQRARAQDSSRRPRRPTPTRCCAPPIRDPDPVLFFEHKGLLNVKGPLRRRSRSSWAAPRSCAAATTSPWSRPSSCATARSRLRACWPTRGSRSS